MNRAQAAELQAELTRMLLAEFGARAIYGRLGRAARDPQLAGLLCAFEHEQHAQVEATRRLMESCGFAAPSDSLRRRALAHALAGLRVVLGQRLVLRICVDAERTRAVGYAQLAEHFARNGPLELARLAQDCATRSARHADALEAWVALA